MKFQIIMKLPNKTVILQLFFWLKIEQQKPKNKYINKSRQVLYLHDNSVRLQRTNIEVETKNDDLA